MRSLVLVLLFVILLAGMLIVRNTYFIQKLGLHRIEGDFLTCNELPTLTEVEQTIADHQSLIQEIEKTNPGFNVCGY